MSKNKPKETIEYVIRLQDKERALMEDFLFSYRMQSLAPSAVALLNDVSGMIMFAMILKQTTGIDIDLTGTLDTAEKVARRIAEGVDKSRDALKTFFEEQKESSQVALGGYNPGGIVGQIIDIIEFVGDAQRQVLTGDPEGGNPFDRS